MNASYHVQKEPRKLICCFCFSGRFDTSGSMLPRLVSEILILYAFCDVGVGVVVVVVGIGDSRSWIIYWHGGALRINPSDLS